MLTDLKILNGNLELKFDRYNYIYTVVVASDVKSLEIEYTVDDNSYVNIRNNIIDNDESIVYIDVSQLDKKETYTLYVYKEQEEKASLINEYVNSLNINRNIEFSFLNIQILCCIVFIIIVGVFALLFKKKRK